MPKRAPGSRYVDSRTMKGWQIRMRPDLMISCRESSLQGILDRSKRSYRFRSSKQKNATGKAERSGVAVVSGGVGQWLDPCDEAVEMSGGVGQWLDPCDEAVEGDMESMVRDSVVGSESRRKTS
ncbi:hypothetical protein GUJ93_ZPchr0007g4667 [Zizania palustris]|uniref:Uncharacterized protein n=1 Tax=Zizania palustris TaxID=103762 RepID=A0A8J5TDD9_ZIZPA|nr:hypothetical protein GUJ93_ZPchr0007g4667 [Zizania palustris]